MDLQGFHASKGFYVPRIDVAVDSATNHVVASLLETQDGCLGKLAEHASCYSQFLAVPRSLHEPNPVSAGSYVHVLLDYDATQCCLESGDDCVALEPAGAQLVAEGEAVWLRVVRGKEIL